MSRFLSVFFKRVMFFGVERWWFLFLMIVKVRFLLVIDFMILSEWF